MTFDFLNLADSNAPYAEALKRAAARVIDSGIFLNGPETRAFERETAEYLGAGHAIAVSNGLDAIRLIFRALLEEGRLKPGDEVIYPANTYIASILPLTELGLKAVAAPADPSTHNLDFSRLEQHITPRTKAILLVHLYGSPCWNTEICRSLREKGILIIEDNAQAFGAGLLEPGSSGISSHCGALGDAAAISFYPTKNLGALGDAGMVVTSDDLLARDVRTLAQYGSDRRYHNVFRGYNNRMDEMQAAFLRIKLPHIDGESRRRQEVAEAYLGSITHPEVILPTAEKGYRHVWHQFVVRSPRRDGLKEWLASNGVATDIHYPLPPHAQPCYEGVFTDSESNPALKEAEDLAATVLSLPIANMSPDDAREVARIINKFPQA